MSKFLSLVSRGSALCAVMGVLALANADVKMVSRMTVTNSMSAPTFPQTVTAYFKKGLMRSDVGTMSTIMNANTHQNLIIDHTHKTYSKLDMLGAMGTRKELLKTMKVSFTGSVKPTSKKKTIAGKPAHLYIADFVMTLSSSKQGQKQNMKMHMEQWTTNAVQAVLSPGQMVGVMGSMFQGLSSMGGMDKLAKQFAKIKGFPLDNSTTMSMVFAVPKGQARPKGSPAAMTFGFSNKVLSVQQTTLSPSMFKVPAGYKKSATPIAPRSGR